MRFSPFDFFHPAMHGSFSMKNVARAIGPDLDYGALHHMTVAVQPARALQQIEPFIVQRQQWSSDRFCECCGPLAMQRIPVVIKSTRIVQERK